MLVPCSDGAFACGMAAPCHVGIYRLMACICQRFRVSRPAGMQCWTVEQVTRRVAHSACSYYFHRDHSTRMLVAARICACDEFQYPAPSCNISAREHSIGSHACTAQWTTRPSPRRTAERPFGFGTSSNREHREFFCGTQRVPAVPQAFRGRAIQDLWALPPAPRRTPGAMYQVSPG